MTVYPIRTGEAPAWIPLLGEAMVAAAASRTDDAVDLIQRIHDEHGAETLIPVCVALADTALHAQGIRDYKPGARLLFGNLKTGALETADDVSPLTASAGRLITARAADDEATFMAILSAAGHSGQLGFLVGALLLVSTTSAVTFLRARKAGAQ